MNAAGALCRDEAELVILELVRLTTTESWTLDGAATALLAKRHSRAALLVAQNRVHRARASQASTIADRAAATLSSTLARAEKLGPSSTIEPFPAPEQDLRYGQC